MFDCSVGNSSSPTLTYRDLLDFRHANKQTGENLATVVRRELNIGWMKLVGGDKAVESSVLSYGNIDNPGALGLEIIGRDGMPVAVSRAKAPGLSDRLRGKMAGTAVRYWARGDAPASRTPGAAAASTGIPITVVCRKNEFLLAPHDLERLVAEGRFGPARHVQQSQDQFRRRQALLGDVHPKLAQQDHEAVRESEFNAHKLGAIHFGLAVRPDGSFEYLADVANLADDLAGYDAGRAYLLEMQMLAPVLEAVLALTLPGVD